MNDMTLESINEKSISSPQKFVIEEDENYRKRIAEAADLIIARREMSPIVLLAGPSGSGKTTTARKLEAELTSRGIISHTISMDDYFKTLNPATAPRTPEGDYDYESPDCLDMELLNEHFTMLSNGEEIHVPYFMFARQKRSASRWTPIKLEKNGIAIFEGIHAFNDVITSAHPEAFKLYISAMSDILFEGNVLFKSSWTRLVRRVVRDDKFRGADASVTLQMWANIVRGEEEHIYPFLGKADHKINSSLGYEMPLLRNYALPLFENLPKNMPLQGEAESAFNALKQFASIDESFVSRDSLIREFIGGGIYEE